VQVLHPLSHGETFSFKDFYVRRAFRILPAFLVVLALYILVRKLREADGIEPWWKFISFTMNLSIDYTQNQAFSHAWSLCVEEHFYLLFPFLAVLLSRKPSRALIVSFFLVIVVAGIGLRTSIWLTNTELHSPNNWFIEEIYYPTWCRFDGLLAGVVLATIRCFRPLIWDKAQHYANPISFIGMIFLGASFLLFRERAGLLGNSVGWPILSFALALLVFAAAQPRSLLGRLRVPGFKWVSTVSYSLYLIHKMALHLVQITFEAQLFGHALLAFSMYSVAIFLAGALLHYTIERPFLLLRTDVLAKQRLA
jgi:peptidoglycan/LPS O-acetylase OafA/YrhL